LPATAAPSRTSIEICSAKTSNVRRNSFSFLQTLVRQ
jgi:hypothetical protein